MREHDGSALRVFSKNVSLGSTMEVEILKGLLLDRSMGFPISLAVFSIATLGIVITVLGSEIIGWMRSSKLLLGWFYLDSLFG